MQHIWIHPVENLEMNVYQYGSEECVAGHSFGPAVRDHFLLHFVISGRGVYATENREYSLQRGMGFLISPDKMTAYRADSGDPWSYLWIGFAGGNAAALLSELSLSPDSPIFRFADIGEIKRIFSDVLSVKRGGMHAQLELTAGLFRLLSRVEAVSLPAEGSAYRLFYSGKDYAESAVQYMQQLYASHITVSGVAEHLGLNRTYFSSLFRRHMGMSPQEYLLKIRVEKAALFLRDRRMSISDVARTVGYEDPLLFSRIFKKYYGVSPREYRKQCT